MNILIVAKTLSITDGQGRYGLGLIKELASKHNLTILTSEIGDSEELKSLPIKIEKIPDLLSLKNFVDFVEYFFRVKKYMADSDTVHFFTDLPNYLIFSPLMFFRTRPYFITAHGTFSIAYLNRGWRRPFLKRFFRGARQVFCVSNFTKGEILKRLNSNNLTVINNAVDFEKFDQLYQKIKTPPQKTATKVIVGVGAIKPRKGYEYALSAVAILAKKYPELKYYIVGSQDNRSYIDGLKKIIENNNIAKNVIFLENITDSELVELYALADLFLFTPVNYKNIYFEGFGLVCLEAGVCEIPVVGSRDCGVADAVKDGVTGYLVPQGEPEQIAAAADKILSDQSLARQLGENNRQFASVMTWKNAALDYENNYMKALKK